MGGVRSCLHFRRRAEAVGFFLSVDEEEPEEVEGYELEPSAVVKVMTAFRALGVELPMDGNGDEQKENAHDDEYRHCLGDVHNEVGHGKLHDGPDVENDEGYAILPAADAAFEGEGLAEHLALSGRR